MELFLEEQPEDQREEVVKKNKNRILNLLMRLFNNIPFIYLFNNLNTIYISDKPVDYDDNDEKHNNLNATPDRSTESSSTCCCEKT